MCGDIAICGCHGFARTKEKQWAFGNRATMQLCNRLHCLALLVAWSDSQGNRTSWLFLSCLRRVDGVVHLRTFLASHIQECTRNNMVAPIPTCSVKLVVPRTTYYSIFPLMEANTY